MTQRIILDVDTGTDDAVALMVTALSPDIELVGATTVNGNCPVDVCTDNTLRTFDAISVDVPVFEGMAHRPNFHRGDASSAIHGKYLDLPPTSGQTFLFDRPITANPLALKRRVGVMAEEPFNATRMTGWELISFFAGLNGVTRPEPRMQELFELLDLWDARHALVHEYSK